MIDMINKPLDFSKLKSDLTAQKLNKANDEKKDKLFDKVLNENIDKMKKKERPVDKKLWDTCQDMESIFVSKMLKEMRKTVHKGDMLHGGSAEEIFEDMLYDEYSLEVTKNADLGIAKMMYNQLSRNI